MFGKKGGWFGGGEGPKKKPEQSKLSHEITEALKNPHVIGWLMEAYQTAKSEGTLEAAAAAAKKRVGEILEMRDSNSYHHVRDVAAIGRTFHFRADQLDMPGVRKNAVELLSRMLESSLHIYGAPRIVQEFVEFMGTDFAKDTAVREAVLVAMSEWAKNAHVTTVPSALASLIKTFKFSEEETKGFMSLGLAHAIANAPDAQLLEEQFRSEDADEDDWAMEDRIDEEDRIDYHNDGVRIPTNLTEDSARAQVADSLKYPHVIGSVRRGYEYAKVANMLEEASVKARERALELLKDADAYSNHHAQNAGIIAEVYGMLDDEELRANAGEAFLRILGRSDINQSHHMQDALALAKTWGFSPDDFSDERFSSSAVELFKQVLDRSYHVWGIPPLMKEYVSFMGEEFRSKPEVRTLVIEKVQNELSGRDPELLLRRQEDIAEINALIELVGLTQEETASFMTPELAKILKEGKWTMDEIQEAYREWSREQYKALGEDYSYKVNFNVSAEMSKRRPK